MAVTSKNNYNLIPPIPDKDKFKLNVIKTELPGIITFQESIEINSKVNTHLTNYSQHKGNVTSIQFQNDAKVLYTGIQS